MCKTTYIEIPINAFCSEPAFPSFSFQIGVINIVRHTALWFMLSYPNCRIWKQHWVLLQTTFRLTILLQIILVIDMKSFQTWGDQLKEENKSLIFSITYSKLVSTRKQSVEVTTSSKAIAEKHSQWLVCPNNAITTYEHNLHWFVILGCVM